MNQFKAVRAQKKRTLFLIIIILLPFHLIFAQNSVRDRTHQPSKVMKIAGVKPGMIIGEVGAGRGYFTFKLADFVGKKGKIYANDINSHALSYINDHCDKENIKNIETIVGKVENPLLPKELDMVFIVNAFHDLEKPVILLNNLVHSLKAGGRVIILDRDPEKINEKNNHFLEKKEIVKIINRSDFEIIQIETFLPQHNLFILGLKENLNKKPILDN